MFSKVLFVLQSLSAFLCSDTIIPFTRRRRHQRLHLPMDWNPDMRGFRLQVHRQGYGGLQRRLSRRWARTITIFGVRQTMTFFARLLFLLLVLQRLKCLKTWWTWSTTPRWLKSIPSLLIWKSNKKWKVRKTKGNPSRLWNESLWVASTIHTSRL